MSNQSLFCYCCHFIEIFLSESCKRVDDRELCCINVLNFLITFSFTDFLSLLLKWFTVYFNQSWGFALKDSIEQGGFFFLTSCETRDWNSDFLSLFVAINIILDLEMNYITGILYLMRRIGELKSKAFFYIKIFRISTRISWEYISWSRRGKASRPIYPNE